MTMIPFLRRTSRYAQVGLLCALSNNIIVIGMDRLGYSYVASVTLASFIALTIAYVLHARYTFRVRASTTGWLRFAIANMASILLSMALMFVLCGAFRMSASIAMPLVTALLFVWNYVLAHLVIAKTHSERA